MIDETIIISDLSPHPDKDEHRTVSRYKRTDVQAVILTENFLHLKRTIPVHLLNYGCKGICLGSEKQLPHFNQIRIRLTFPDHDSFELEGVVLYCQAPDAHNPLHHCGIQLTEENSAYKDFILRDGMRHKLNNCPSGSSN